jgi:hypothetical protein
VEAEMKLFELTGVHSQKEKDMLQLLKDISGEGSKFKKAGEGVAAQVLVHSSGTVYKFWAKDSAYEKFVQFVEQHQSDKHLPKLKSKIKKLHSFFKKPKDFPEKIKYVKMEQLTPIKYSDLLPGAKNVYLVDAIKTIYHGIAHHKSNSLRWVVQNIREDEGTSLSDESLDLIDSLFATIKLMCEKIPEFEQSAPDWHSGNIMMRGKDVVIVDPMIDAGDMKFNKELMAQIKQLHKDSDANS